MGSVLCHALHILHTTRSSTTLCRASHREDLTSVARQYKSHPAERLAICDREVELLLDSSPDRESAILVEGHVQLATDCVTVNRLDRSGFQV